MKRLDGRVAILTGANGGIGPLLAKHLANRGMRLVLLARNRGGLEGLASTLRANGTEVAVVAGDVRSPERMEEALAAAADLGGGLGLLVHNAGVEGFSHFAAADPQEIEDTIAINLTAPLRFTRMALPTMEAGPEGHVVFMASVAGLMGTPYGAVYSATKAGLIAANISLRMEYVGRNIGFSAICPSFVHGGGMHDPHIREAGDAPGILGGCSTEEVAQATLRAITEDIPEVIVNRFPVRPLVGLGRTFPRLSVSLAQGAAVPYMKKIADARRS